MKSLLIVRHAKSDWSTYTLNDFERPLNDRGRANAPMMGKRLLAKSFQPDVVLCSSANRAKETCTLICKELDFALDQINYYDSLYHAGLSALIDHIIGIDDQYATAMLVAHNPGITHFVNEYFRNLVEQVPTCGMLQMQIDTSSWADFDTAKKQFGFYDFPKNQAY